MPAQTKQSPCGERPASPPSGGGSVINIVGLVVGVPALFVCGFIGVAIYLVMSSRPPVPTGPVAIGPGVTEPPQPPPGMRIPEPPQVPPVKRPTPPAPPPEPPKPTLALPPAPPPVAIAPAPVKEQAEYKLPEVVGGVAVGGGGRYLCLLFPKLGKVGIFDVNVAKLTHYVPAPEENARVAATMNDLFVLLPTAGLIRRHDLADGKQEKSVKVEVKDRVDSFAAGSASAGPLLLSDGNRRARLLDADTLQPMEAPEARGGYRFGLEQGLYTASADGRTVGWSGVGGGMPNGAGCLTLRPDRVEMKAQHIGSWFVAAAPDGRHVFPAGYGGLTDQMTAASDVVFSATDNRGGTFNKTYLPAVHGPFYVHCHTKLFKQGDEPDWGVSVSAYGNNTPIAVLKDVPIPTYSDLAAIRDLGFHNCIQLIPKAKLLAIIPSQRDRLVLVPLDLEAALEKSGADYLLFTSDPPAVARRGAELEYRVAARGKGGKVTFSLESGPDGMTVSQDGILRWKVPADFTDAQVTVIVLGKSAAGREGYQTFPLRVEGQ